VPYRLAGKAQDQIDRILLETARAWGTDAADRYHRLMLAAMVAVGDAPVRPGSRGVARLAGVRVFSLRLARRLIEREHRVAQPRHLVIYRVGLDDVVEVLGFVHDRMLLTRAARRMHREAGG